MNGRQSVTVDPVCGTTQVESKFGLFVIRVPLKPVSSARLERALRPGRHGEGRRTGARAD